MKLQFRKLALAAAIVTTFASGAAFAGDFDRDHDHHSRPGYHQDNDGQAASLTADGQISVFNSFESDFGYNRAGGANNSLNGASGNIGINFAAGEGNQQANGVTIAVTGAKDVSADTFALQVGALNGFDDFRGTNYLLSTNKANVGDGSLNYSSGNINVNSAAGSYNQQKNDDAFAVSKGNGDEAMAQATAVGLEISALNGTGMFATDNSASLGNNSLNHASGNIGVNVAAGSGNQQQNHLAVAVTKGDDTDLALATVVAVQGNFGQDTAYCGVSNVATLGNNSLNGAHGNIGVNIAAGTNNQQFNALAIAVNK